MYVCIDTAAVAGMSNLPADYPRDVYIDSWLCMECVSAGVFCRCSTMHKYVFILLCTRGLCTCEHMFMHTNVHTHTHTHTYIHTYIQSSADYVSDIQWSPYISTIFASVTGDGYVCIWDMSISTLDPIISEKISPRRPTCIRFSPNSNVVVAGDDTGRV